MVVNPSRSEKKWTDMFSFAEKGKLTRPAMVIFSLWACCTLTSIIIIGVKSSTRAPLEVMERLAEQQCPLLSSTMYPTAFREWLDSCPAVLRGNTYPCYSQVDCVMLGSQCAPVSILSALSCIKVHDADENRKVCAYPPLSNPEKTPAPGFCPSALTTCGVCISGNCKPLSNLSVGGVGCVTREECKDSSHWVCTTAISL